MTKVIGIIGGMGPAATLDLLEKIYANSEADCDQLHLRVLADIDPTIPDRTAAIIGSEGREELVRHLLHNALGLIQQGAEVLAMPCNTAHAFLKYFQGELSVPLINIINVSVEYILKKKWKRVGLMATDGTLAARLYISELQGQGIEVITPSEENQAVLMKAIYAFKGGETKLSAKAAVDVYGSLLSAGAQQVIAACTELPILLRGQEHVVDPTYLLARSLIQAAANG